MLKTMVVEHAGRGLRLATGSPARMLSAAGEAKDASSHSLTRQDILQLVLPIMPEHARRRLPQENSVDFEYTSPSGPFNVTVLRNGSEIVVTMMPDANTIPAATPPP